MTDTTPLLAVTELVKDFHPRGRSSAVRAVDHVSFEVRRGESFGLVGESGCGKSTIARCVVALERYDSGGINFDSVDIGSLDRGHMQRLRRRMQLVFQDPYSSLDPRMTVQAIVEEGLDIHGIGSATERSEKSRDRLDVVGIGEDMLSRKPHALSGGQRQRVAIARALVLDPDLVVLDEAVSALDVSVQAQVLNLLKDLQTRLSLTYLFIVHDLTLAEYFCDRVAVLYRGAIVELASSRELFAQPLHPYTAALFAAAPGRSAEERRERVLLRGEVADYSPGQSGCRFRSRCPVGRNRAVCADKSPPLSENAQGHLVACHFAGESPPRESQQLVE